MQNPKFVVKNGDGSYYFHLTASNGEIILVRQNCASVPGAENGITSVKVTAAIEERYERRRSRRDEPYSCCRRRTRR